LSNYEGLTKILLILFTSLNRLNISLFHDIFICLAHISVIGHWSEGSLVRRL